jgi:prephenate dehydrogenase
MSTPKITIVGLGLIGKSIGEMLCQTGGQLQVVGHDREPLVAREAQKAGAVNRIHWNVIDACDGADVVIIAAPLPGVRDVLQAIASDLKPGCLVMDTATLKAPVLQWADDALPAEVNFVGGNPILSVEPSSETDKSRPDLLKGKLFCLTPSVKAAPEGIHLATDVVRLLEAKPFFLDAAEHDGLIAGVEQLPIMLSLSLLQTVSREASWREIRKLAGTLFEDTTRVLSQDAGTLRDSLLLNRDSVTRLVDQWVETLQELREAVQSQDEDGLQQTIEEIVAVHQGWLNDRSVGLWDKPQAPDIPTGGGFMGRMFGLRRGQDDRQEPSTD